MIGSPHHVIQDVGGGVEPVGDFNFSVRESGGTHGAGDCRGQYSVSYICSHKRISLRRLVALRIPKSQRLPAPNLPSETDPLPYRCCTLMPVLKDRIVLWNLVTNVATSARKVAIDKKFLPRGLAPAEEF